MYFRNPRFRSLFQGGTKHIGMLSYTYASVVMTP